MSNINSKSYLTSLIIKEIYIITGTRYTFKILVKMQSWKGWTISRIVKNICKQALLHTIGSTMNWYIVLGKKFDKSDTIFHIYFLWSSHYTSKNVL